MRRRVRGQQHLEAAIELESVDAVSADASADRVCRLENKTALPSRLELTRTRQTGEAAADDHHTGHGSEVVISN